MKKRWLGVVALMAVGAAQASWQVMLDNKGNPTNLSDSVWTFTVDKQTVGGVAGLRIKGCTAGQGSAVVDLTDTEADCGWKVVYILSGVFNSAGIKEYLTKFVGPEVRALRGGDMNSSPVFNGCANLEEVVFSDDLCQIGRSCFSSCSKLTKFSPRRMEKMTSLYRGCLSGLSNLEGGFDFPNVTMLEGDGGEDFSGDAKLEWVKLPKLGVINKGGVFYNCSALTSVDLSGVTQITSEKVFQESGLRNLELPELTMVTASAFTHMRVLERLYIPKIELLKSANADLPMFRYTTALKHLEPTTMPYLHCIDNIKLFCRDGTATPVEGDFYFPALTNLSQAAFAGTKISSFVAPQLKAVTAAFGNCVKLTNVVLSTEITVLNHGAGQNTSYGAFEGCTALTNCVLGDLSNLSVLGKRAFYNCNQMTNEIVLASPAIRDIFDETFYNCQKVPSFTIASPVTNVGSKAFMNLGGGVSVTFTKDVEAAPTLWGATTPIASVANPFPVIRVEKNLASWKALSGFTAIENVASKYKTEGYGYTGKKDQVGLFNEKAWVVDASAPAGSVLMLM